jgi:hypothetical protein
MRHKRETDHGRWIRLQRIVEQVRRRVFQIELVPGFDGSAQPVRT